MAEWPSDGGRLVRDALARLDDPSYLETCALARLIDGASAPPVASRGRLVRAWLDEAVAALSEGVLPLRYREGLTVSEVCRRLGVSRSEYYRRHERGCDAVASLLRARARPFGPAAPEVATNARLPRALTSFVGRDAEMAAVRDLLASARLLTLTGPPGAGKTRLAIEAASAVAGTHRDGAWLIELAPVADGDLIAQTVLDRLGVRVPPTRPPEDVLAAHLAPRDALLILDNCEHLRAACARVVEAVLGAGGRTRVLVTSREPLRVPGEQEFPVPPLAAPGPRWAATPDALAAYPAVRLFLDRARLVQPAFALTAANAAAVAEVCRRLDGLPLAIELAAARVRVLPVQGIADRLDDRFRLLASADPAPLPHHRTLRALVDWSHDLLAERERLLLRRLAVFRGGCTLEAATAVCASPGESDLDALDGLEALVARGLLQQQEIDGAPRFVLLETVREYGLELLDQAGEIGAARDRHRDWCLDLAERAAPELNGPRQAWWFDRLTLEHDNLRAALARCVEADAERGLRLAAALRRFWQARAHYAEGRRWLGELLARPSGPTEARLLALLAAGMLARSQGDFGPARTRLEESVALARALGSDPDVVAEALRNLADVLGWTGDYGAARARLTEALTLGRATGDGHSTGPTLLRLGWVTQGQGDYRAAAALLEEGLALVRAAGDPYQTANGLGRLASVVLGRGEDARARALLAEGLAIAQEIDGVRVITLIRCVMGDAARRRDDAEDAAAQYEHARGLARAHEDAQLMARSLVGLAWAADRRGEVARAAALLQECRARSTGSGDRPGVGAALHALGRLAAREGDAPRAERRLRESLAVRQEMGERVGVVECLEASAAVALRRRQPARAARLLGAAESMRRTTGAARPPAEEPAHEADRRAAREALGERAFAAAEAAGGARPDAVVAEALSDPTSA